MSTVATLDTLKAFLEEKVALTIKLQKADNDNVKNYELVNPQIHVGWIPPKGFLPSELDHAIPCLLVGYDGGEDDSQTAEENIRITAVVYSPGRNNPEAIYGSASYGDALDPTYYPRFSGYIDLLNLIDRTKAELVKNQIINKSLIIQYPIKWGMYEEQPYPYWYGWVTFAVRKASYPAAGLSKYL